MLKEDFDVLEDAMSEHWRLMALFSAINKAFADSQKSFKEKIITSLEEMARAFGTKKIIVVPGTKAEAIKFEPLLIAANNGKLKSIRDGQAQIYNAREPHYFQELQNELKMNSLILLPILLNGEIKSIIVLCDKKSGQEYTLFEQTIASVWSIFANQGLSRQVEALNPFMGPERARQEFSEDFKLFFSSIDADGKTERKPSHEEKKFRTGAHKVAILFADMRGFTKLTKELRGSPDIVTKILHDFGKNISGIIYSHQGIISKFLGDGVMAIFGAGMEESQDPADMCSRALSAAIEIKKKFIDVFSVWQQTPEVLDSMPENIDINIGIGLSFGECTLVELTYGSFYEFTAIGEYVNIAHRLVSKAKRLLTVDESIKLPPNIPVPHDKKYETASILAFSRFIAYCPEELLKKNEIKMIDLEILAKDYERLPASEIRSWGLD